MEMEERRKHILELLGQSGKVRVNELSEMFNISDVTVRSDLASLEAEGLLSRVHGGAVSSYKTYHNMSLQQRLHVNNEEKRQIALRAAELIHDNDTIMLNSGTTTLMVLRCIPVQRKLSIITNSLSIALEAGNNPNFHVVLLGGAVNSRYQFVYGDDANAQLSQYYADKLILSVDGISMENGLTTYYDREAELCRLMLSRAATRIVAADCSKIGRTAFARISGAEEAEYLITNETPTVAEELSEISKAVQNIILVKQPAGGEIVQ